MSARRLNRISAVCVPENAALTADGEFVLPLTNEPHRKHRIAFQIFFKNSLRRKISTWPEK